MKPIFCFSLDLELGVGLEHSRHNRNINPEIGRKAVLKILELAKKYQIPLTFGVVGHLFLKECQGQHFFVPSPSWYQGDWYKKDPKTNFGENKIWYAPDLIEKIKKEGHEIACHSFSHISFCEATREVAEAEIKQSLKVARDCSITLETFIFPRNEVNYLDLLKKYNFKFFVSQQTKQSFLHSHFPKPKLVKGLLEVPRTYYLYGASLKQQIKITQLLFKAKLTKKFFHLWTHCWCLNSPQHFRMLERVFKLIRILGFDVVKLKDCRQK